MSRRRYGRAEASATLNATRPSGSSPTLRSRARIISSEMSTPRTLARGNSRARNSAASPVPVPRSRTRSGAGETCAVAVASAARWLDRAGPGALVPALGARSKKPSHRPVAAPATATARGRRSRSGRGRSASRRDGIWRSPLAHAAHDPSRRAVSGPRPSRPLAWPSMRALGKPIAALAARPGGGRRARGLRRRRRARPPRAPRPPRRASAPEVEAPPAKDDAFKKPEKVLERGEPAIADGRPRAAASSRSRSTPRTRRRRRTRSPSWPSRASTTAPCSTGSRPGS